MGKKQNKQNQLAASEPQSLLRTMGEVQQREAAAADGRRLTLSFSSEQPYNRWFGPEILDHSPGALDLERLNSVGVLLFNHDTDKVLGKVLRAWVDEKRRGMAEVEFDTDEEAEKIFAKVNSGTLKTTSVRYRVDSWEEIKQGATSADGRYTGPCQVARHWTPFEVSIVSVPADASVGVGRGAGDEFIYKKNEEENGRMDENNKNDNSVTVQSEPNTATGGGGQRDLQQEAVQTERARANDIMQLCREVGLEAEEYIRNGTTVEEVRQAAWKHLIQQARPVQNRGAGGDDNDLGQFCRAAADALLLRSGQMEIEETEQADKLRNLSLRDLMVESLVREGEGTTISLLRKSKDELWEMAVRQFAQPTAAFPAILDNAINKAIVQSYDEMDTTFQLWTAEGSLTDFKLSKEHEYLLGGGKFSKVSEGGELKHSTLETEKLPQRQLGTYGTQFSMSREAFINDDVGLLVEMPAKYAKAAKREINHQVYELIFKNSKIFDGKALFDADTHKNVLATGCEPSIEAVQALMLLLMQQTDPFGNAINVKPKNMILPLGYGFKAAQILQSQTVNTSENTQAFNALYQYRNNIQIIEEGELNVLAGGAPVPWFVSADPKQVGSVKVDYLNGNKRPIFRRSEKTGYLGFFWDIYMDWVVSVKDWRGIAKNPGVKIR